MAEIKDCVGKNVKISKASISIKNEEGKTCGVVRNITSLYDLQPNKQMEYYRVIRNLGIYGKISIKDCIISDGIMYIFRNVKSKLFHEKYGYMNDYEREMAEEKERIYKIFKDSGIVVIECVYV